MTERFLAFLILLLSNVTFAQNNNYLLYTASARDISFHWQNKNGALYQNFGNLNQEAQSRGKRLLFAMNGGIYDTQYRPLGLYVEKGQQLRPLDTNPRKGYGNFRLLPNGVFYIRKNGTAGVLQTTAYDTLGLKDVLYATQSGPMLLIDGQIHPDFNPKSSSYNIRNGVCVRNNSQVLFVMSKVWVTFYDMASYFKNTLGCQNALYLDGGISRVYLPEQGYNNLGGDFSIIMAVIK